MERESRTIEYKRSIGSFPKLAKTVIAFANGDGGEIVIGIDDKSRKVLGLCPDEIDDLLERIPVSLADQIQPPIFPHLFEKTMDDKEVLVLRVFPANLRPCFLASEGVDKGVYIRVGAHTRKAQGEILEELRLLRSRMNYDEVPIQECSLDSLNTTALPATLRTEKGMHSLGIFRHDSLTGAKVPVRGAILMLHPEPERLVPEAYVVLSRMRGEKGRNTVASLDIKGSIPHQADTALAQLEEWLGRNPSLNGARLVNRRWALPMEAVREGINNALLHRQYSIPGPVKIALYANRLEVFSPGHFAGPFVPESLGDGTSYIRNRVICTIARRMGLIEKRGTGIRLIKDAMLDAGLSDPLFEEGALWFRVTLSLEPNGKGHPVTNPEEGIMALFETRPEVSSADVCNALSVSRVTAVSHLKRFMDQGLIERIGKGPKTRYRVKG